MTFFLDWFLTSTGKLSGWIWGLPMIALLFGTGILLTIRTRFVQIRNLGVSLRLILKGANPKEENGESSQGDITPFQALMTSLSATVGNGNIAGVATAIAAGGPGAAFWMWVTAVVGMATKYSEAVLSILFRKQMTDGSMAGGPMYYCRDGVGGFWGSLLGGLFAVCGAATALLGTGNMFQTQSMALAMKEQFGTPQWTTGLIISLLAGMVIIGGIRRIGAVAERLVPIMIVFYFTGALIVLISNFLLVPKALKLIFVSAFTPEAAFGATIGISIAQAMRFGVARGVLSNESGLGSAAIAHGAARTRYPVAQGGIAMMGTFIDTIVVCTLTALAITVSGAYESSSFMSKGGLMGADLTVHAFNIGMPDWLKGQGGFIVAFSSLIFGFTTLIGWSYYGQICLEYLVGLKVIKPYRFVYLILLFVGALLTGKYSSIVTNVGDICNAAMAFPNLIALILLSRRISAITLNSYRKGGPFASRVSLLPKL